MSYFVFIVLLLFIVLFLNAKEIRQARLLDAKSDRHYLFATQIVLFLGVLIRLIYLEYPFGINLDEAISGYDAWSLAHYGVDQHLYSYPVYLKSWGSGQSALYAYLSAPLVKLFGLSLPVHRLPMAIVSSAALFFFYYALKKAKMKSLFIFLCILFFVLNPWHLTKSRWALDCNLAPDLLLIATSLIVIAYHTQKEKLRSVYLILGFFFVGLTAYGYAVSWMMLPFYSVGLLVFLYRKRVITLRQSFVYPLVTLLVAIPLVLFAFQLITGGEALSIGGISIPELNKSRHETTSILAMNGTELYSYIFNTIKSLFTGYDHLLTNSFPYTGQFYNPIGWIFVLLAVIFFLRNRELNIFDTLFLIWLLCCIPIIFSVTYNVNRWNMIWIPLVYFCFRGVYICIADRRIAQVAFYLVFAFLTTVFALNYKLIHSKGFLADIKEAVEITSQKNIHTVYFTDRVQYPAVLFYDPISPFEFNKTKEEVSPEGDFIFLKKFGKYTMNVITPFEPKPNTAYVIPSEYLSRLGIDPTAYHIWQGETLTVLWCE